jgi:hypothetical protein
MHKIALAGFGVGVFLAALAPTNAVERRHHPRYEGRSVYTMPGPVYEGRSAFALAPPVMAVPHGPRGGCLLANYPAEVVKGIRHYYPACRG